MIHKIEAGARHFSDFDWLKTYWLFSFSDYHDAKNIHFGALRVFNDDVVAPGSGFPMHSHNDMEIVTIVREGRLTHEDSLGHRGVIGAGEVQRMSAGTGITHSEFNMDKEPCHLYQIWIHPAKRDLKPSYAQQSFAGAVQRGWLLPVVSGRGLRDALTINADATVYLGDLGVGDRITVETDPSRRLFVYVTQGELEIEGQKFGTGDQARIEPEGPLVIGGISPAEFVFIDVPAVN